MPPRPGPGANGPINMKALNKNALKRLLSYLKDYKFSFSIVVICIIAAALTSVVGMTYLETIIDDHIKPMLLNGSTDFSGLLRVIIEMAAVFSVSIVATLLQGILMARVGQGVQTKIRGEMFGHMQKLPIKYFITLIFRGQDICNNLASVG